MADSRFDYPTASAPSASVVISNFEYLPLDRPEEKFQSKRILAGGDTVVQDLGLSQTSVKINVDLLSAANYALLQTFFQTTVNYMEKTFSYTDPAGTVYNLARLTKPNFQLQRVSNNTDAMYTGTIILELEPA